MSQICNWKYNGCKNDDVFQIHLIAVQNEPAVLVYGAIAFLFLVGFALLISTANEEMGDRSQGTKELIASSDLSLRPSQRWHSLEGLADFAST